MRSTSISINDNRLLYLITVPRHLREDVANLIEASPRAEVRALARQLYYANGDTHQENSIDQRAAE
jgi:hypothetical protein